MHIYIHTFLHTYIYTYKHTYIYIHIHWYVQKNNENAHKYIHTNTYIQDVSRPLGITSGDDFLGLFDQKVHINMCPNLDVYGVMTVF